MSLIRAVLSILFYFPTESIPDVRDFLEHLSCAHLIVRNNQCHIRVLHLFDVNTPGTSGIVYEVAPSPERSSRTAILADGLAGTLERVLMTKEATDTETVVRCRCAVEMRVTKSTQCL